MLHHQAHRRCCSPPLRSVPISLRWLLSFGMPTDLSNLDFVKKWREMAGSFKPIPPVVVKDGPILENVQQGKDVNVLKFPTVHLLISHIIL